MSGLCDIIHIDMRARIDIYMYTLMSNVCLVSFGWPTCFFHTRFDVSVITKDYILTDEQSGKANPKAPLSIFPAEPAGS